MKAPTIFEVVMIYVSEWYSFYFSTLGVFTPILIVILSAVTWFGLLLLSDKFYSEMWESISRYEKANKINRSWQRIAALSGTCISACFIVTAAFALWGHYTAWHPSGTAVTPHVERYKIKGTIARQKQLLTQIEATYARLAEAQPIVQALAESSVGQATVTLHTGTAYERSRFDELHERLQEHLANIQRKQALLQEAIAQDQKKLEQHEKVMAELKKREHPHAWMVAQLTALEPYGVISETFKDISMRCAAAEMGLENQWKEPLPQAALDMLLTEGYINWSADSVYAFVEDLKKHQERGFAIEKEALWKQVEEKINANKLDMNHYIIALGLALTDKKALAFTGVNVDFQNPAFLFWEAETICNMRMESAVIISGMTIVRFVVQGMRDESLYVNEGKIIDCYGTIHSPSKIIDQNGNLMNDVQKVKFLRNSTHYFFYIFDNLPLANLKSGHLHFGSNRTWSFTAH